MEPSLWMPAAGDRERRLPCFARGLIPDGCELLERCWVLEAYSQRTACSSFCLFIALGSAVRPAASLLCVSCCSRSILVSFNCFCSPRAVLTPNTCCLLTEQAGQEPGDSIQQSPLDLQVSGSAQSSLYNKIFLWFCVLKFIIGFAFYFIRYYLRENALNFSPVK